MTPAEVDADAELIRGAVQVTLARGIVGEVEMARARLSAELGQRLGWRRYLPARRAAQHLFGKRPAWVDRDTMPYADHSGCYIHDGKTVALVEQPYRDFSVGSPVLAEVERWAFERGLFLHFPDFPSWWLPGRTTLVLVLAKQGRVPAELGRVIQFPRR